jgi:hypothetical protein
MSLMLSWRGTLGKLSVTFSRIDVLAHLLRCWLSCTAAGRSWRIRGSHDTLLGVFLRIPAIVLGHETIVDEDVVDLLNVQVNVIVVMLVEVAVDVLLRGALTLAVLLMLWLRLRLWRWLLLRGINLGLRKSMLHWLSIAIAIDILLIVQLIWPNLRAARRRVAQRCLVRYWIDLGRRCDHAKRS